MFLRQTLFNTSLACFRTTTASNPPLCVSTFRRAMSSAPTLSATPAAGKHRFIVYAPDKTDEGTLARRLEVREKHLAGARAGHDTGLLRLGGMMTTPEAITNPEAPKQMIGSVLIYEAESLEKVKEIVESDIYYTAGVWDPARIIISPFFSAFPL